MFFKRVTVTQVQVRVTHFTHPRVVITNPTSSLSLQQLYFINVFFGVLAPNRWCILNLWSNKKIICQWSYFLTFCSNISFFYKSQGSICTSSYVINVSIPAKIFADGQPLVLRVHTFKFLVVQEVRRPDCFFFLVCFFLSRNSDYLASTWVKLHVPDSLPTF